MTNTISWLAWSNQLNQYLRRLILTYTPPGSKQRFDSRSENLVRLIFRVKHKCYRLDLEGFKHACHHGLEKIAAMDFVEGKLDTIDSGPLKYAINCGKLNVVKDLLDLGIDVNGPPRCTQTCGSPLWNAISSPHIDIIQLLLERGAEIAFAGITANTFTKWREKLGEKYDEIKQIIEHAGEITEIDRFVHGNTTKKAKSDRHH